jgi:hypothetical protein
MKKEKWQKLNSGTTFDKLTSTTGWKSGTGWKSEGDFIGTDEEDTQTVAYLSNRRNNSNRTKEETKANGRLIAAAPDLLAAAITFVNRIGDYYEISSESSTLWRRGGDEWDELTALKEAINKAL